MQPSNRLLCTWSTNGHRRGFAAKQTIIEWRRGSYLFGKKNYVPELSGTFGRTSETLMNRCSCLNFKVWIKIRAPRKRIANDTGQVLKTMWPSGLHGSPICPCTLQEPTTSIFPKAIVVHHISYYS